MGSERFGEKAAMSTTSIVRRARTSSGPQRPGAGRSGFTPGDITRSLLGYLVLAGPCYVLVSLIQAFTRTGFDPVRDEWSLLALGRLGWIQQANLALTGVMVLAGAVGMRRALTRTAAGGTSGPRLLAGYGLALIGAGAFRADAAGGFPPGAPSGRATHLSGHGSLHLLFGSLGFICLIAACFVMAHHYQQRANRSAAVASRVVGLIFAVAFAGIATGAGNAAVNLAFTAAVIVSCAWLSAVAVNLYRGTRRANPTPSEPQA
jgi:Protein of unknown function (DUF998)